MARFTSLINLLSETLATTPGTSATPFDVSGRKAMSIQFTTGAGGGNGTYEVQISNDYQNWVTYNRLTTNATNTNSQTDIGVSSVAVNAGSSAIYFIRNGDHFRYIRGSVTGSAAGSYNAVLSGIDV